MVDVGETVTVVPLSEPGIQEYVEAPEAVSVVLPPEHIAVFAVVAPTVGGVFTVTVTGLLLAQVLFVAVNVYVVVDVTPLATGFTIDVLLRNVAGDQL